MNISIWDHIRERHGDKLTHTQRTIRHGIVYAAAISLGAFLKMPIDAFFGNEAKLEQSLVFAGSALGVGVVFTVVDLLRGPRPAPEPDLHLTEEMQRRVR